MGIGGCGWTVGMLLSWRKEMRRQLEMAVVGMLPVRRGERTDSLGWLQKLGVRWCHHIEVEGW